MVVNGHTKKLCMCGKMDNISIYFYQVIIKLKDSLSDIKNMATVFCVYVVYWVEIIHLF